MRVAKVTCTIACYSQQLSAVAELGLRWISLHPVSKRIRQNPYRETSVWGIFIYTEHSFLIRGGSVSPDGNGRLLISNSRAELEMSGIRNELN